MSRAGEIREARRRRHRRVRTKVVGSAERPRLSVFRSLNHIYAQVVDDSRGVTLAAASSLDPSLRPQLDGTKRQEARCVGEALAKRALERGLTSVVLDRGGYLYHGRVKALAEGARAGGLKF